MKFLIWLWVFVCSLTYSFGQVSNTVDSLKSILKVQNDKDAINTACRLAWEFQNSSKLDSAILYYKLALSLAANKEDDKWLASIYFNIGYQYDQLHIINSASEFYEKALTLYEKLGDDDNSVRILTNLAISFKNVGAYEKALRTILKAIQIIETKDASRDQALLYNTIALIYAESETYDQAIIYYRKAINLFQKFDRVYLAKSYNNLGELFTKLHQFDSAKHHLLNSIAIKRELNDTKGLGRTINNLGKVAMLTGNNTEAEQLFNESLSIERTIDDPVGMIEVLNNLGKFHTSTHHYNQSQTFLLEAQDLIQKAQSPEHLKQNLELQVSLAREQNDFKRGMLLMEQLLVIRDSLLGQEKTKSLQALRIRYETEKKEQQITLLEQREEINKAKIKNNQILVAALAFGLILVAAIGTLIYINLRNARASRNRIELLLSETRHRIKNNLQTLASIFHLQTRHYTDQEMVLEARTSESRVHAMSMLHERFYASETDHTVGTKSYITDLVQKLVDIYGWRTKDLHLAVEIDEIELDIDKALALSLIIQELVCNAFKYAFDHEPEPALSVTLHSNDSEVITTIKDNGIGIDEESIGTSQGFGLVEALVSQLDGEMEIVKRDGTMFIITFPLTQPWKKRLF